MVEDKHLPINCHITVSRGTLNESTLLVAKEAMNKRSEANFNCQEVTERSFSPRPGEEISLLDKDRAYKISSDQESFTIFSALRNEHLARELASREK